MAEDQGGARLMSLMDLMAGKAKISVELNERGEWIGQWKPVDADDHPPEVPEEVTETGWNAVPMPTVGRGEIRPTNMQESIADQIENCRTRPPWEDRIPAKSRGESLWDAYRQGSRYVYGKKIREMIDAAWKEAGEKCGVDALREYGWLPDIMPHDAWDIGCSWASIVDALAAVVRDAIEGDEA